MRRKLQADRVAVVLLNLHDDVVGEQQPVVAEHIPAERQRLVAPLVHEVIAVAVGVEEGRRMTTRSGSWNLSPALNVLSNTARVSRLRILSRTSVWPPRAVGFETSTSRQ